MKYLPKNTLSYFQAAPQFRLHALGNTPISVIAGATTKYRDDTDDSPCPDDHAIEFYALNHCASIVRELFTPNEPLPPWALGVMNSYMDVMVKQSERLLHYTVSIITREMRHLKGPSAKLEKGLMAISPVMFEFIKVIQTKNESHAVDYYMKNSPKDVPCSVYAQALALAFDIGGWNGGYGGKPWGQIAKTVQQFFEGKTSLEMMVDTAYTLAHNNGPMFNKGMLYSMYTDKFIMILDIQRSGQIPELLLDTKDWTKRKMYLGSATKSIVESVKAEVPGAFGTYVDWDKVQNLGAVGTYVMQAQEQKKLHPQNVVTKFMGQPATVVGEFQVWPGQSAIVLERKKAA